MDCERNSNEIMKELQNKIEEMQNEINQHVTDKKVQDKIISLYKDKVTYLKLDLDEMNSKVLSLEKNLEEMKDEKVLDEETLLGCRKGIRKQYRG